MCLTVDTLALTLLGMSQLPQNHGRTYPVHGVPGCWNIGDSYTARPRAWTYLAGWTCRPMSASDMICWMDRAVLLFGTDFGIRIDCDRTLSLAR